MLFDIPLLVLLLSSLYYLGHSCAPAAFSLVSIMRVILALTVSVYFHYACFPRGHQSILHQSALKQILMTTVALDSVALAFLESRRATLKSTADRNYPSLLRKAIESPSAT
jgi:hypothetical protein